MASSTDPWTRARTIYEIIRACYDFIKEYGTAEERDSCAAVSHAAMGHECMMLPTQINWRGEPE